jgi:DNA-binding transcriptional ArsR family regulator
MLEHIYVIPYIDDMILEADTLFRLLADTTRLRIVMLLQQAGELCVCELTHALDLSQPKISRHLAHLREGGLLLQAPQRVMDVLPYQPGSARLGTGHPAGHPDG